MATKAGSGSSGTGKKGKGAKGSINVVSATSVSATSATLAATANPALDVVQTMPGLGLEGSPSLAPLLSPVTNLFTPGRSGRPVVRPDDLLAVRISGVNLEVRPGSPPRLKRRSSSGDAYLIVHHPPQAIAEEVFYEQKPAGVDTAKHDAPPGMGDRPPPSFPQDTNVDPAPIRARAAGESKLVFEWPPGLVCDYTLDAVLAAIRSLRMKVPPGAAARASRLVLRPWPLFSSRVAKGSKGAKGAKSSTKDATDLTAAAHLSAGALQSFSLRQTLLSQRGDAAAQATVWRRLADVVQVAPDFGVRPDVLLRAVKPSAPTWDQTALEVPWRLIVSPHAGEQWRHALKPVHSGGTQHVELWHTRLLGAGTQPTEPPQPDGSRTLRAVWATTGPSGKPMQRDYPQGFSELPNPGEGDPFLGTLNDYDRYQVTHLSSNFATSYKPEPLDVNLLMLSSLGAWLDSKGEWEPEGLDVESWVHRASMGRDHYVRVVYRGVLFPFGHRAVLIKVSERKFHSQRDGNPAYLRQRMFLVVRERERSYLNGAQLKPSAGDGDAVKNNFPFSHVRMLTTVTPDLAEPKFTQIQGKGQLLFWPALGAGPNPEPFKFRMVATDLDGSPIQFELPLIFMSNSMASPRRRAGRKLVPLHEDLSSAVRGAATCATWALQAWNQRLGPADASEPSANDWAVAQLKRQRVAFALSDKPGDTALEVVHMTFSAWAPQIDPNSASFKAFKAWTPDLVQPMFFPMVLRAKVRVAAMAQLTGSEKFNHVGWNGVYSKQGFGSGNKGQVFLNLVESQAMAKLDFSKQGDRSGGFVMPNLQPSALSRTLGPVAGNVQSVVDGVVEPTSFFPPGGMGDLPLPLLFGCIPLSAIIQAVGNLAGELDKAPKFASSAGTQLEQFFNNLMRLYQLVTQLAAQPGSMAEAALDVAKGTLDTLKSQAGAFGAQGTALKTKVDEVLTPLNALRLQLAALATKSFDLANPLAGIDLSAAQAPNGLLRQRLLAFQTAVNAASVVPAGYRQAVNALVTQALTVLDAVLLISNLATHGKQLFDALKALLDNDAPGQSLGELITQPAVLKPKLQLVNDRLGGLKTDVQGFPLLDGPARQTLVVGIEVVQQALSASGPLLDVLESLLGEELVIRFDWRPKIKSWGFSASDPLFKVHDDRAFIVAVEARVKKSGGAPKIQVLCGLRHFDLVLIAPASFIELNFEKIEFKVDTSSKMNVDVLLSDIKFVGPLSFVEVLKDFIPLDGFSDPPYLDITPQGIDAGFDISLPTIACGVLNLSNVSLGAGFTVPFIGQPLSVRFNFCTREQPFHLTVYCFGGGGFFGVTLDPRGVQLLEAAFEFGAAISIDLGVASGGVSVMAGIYFRMEADAASLTGYFRLEGHVDVMGLITASLELYLELRYEFETGKAVGKASLTIEIEVLIFSGSVTITCEKKFAGSNGDPTLRQLLGVSASAALPLADELQSITADTQYGWRSYCEAFA